MLYKTDADATQKLYTKEALSPLSPPSGESCTYAPRASQKKVAKPHSWHSC